MFYCDDCAEKEIMPRTKVKSEGICEKCGQFAICNIMPKQEYWQVKSERNDFLKNCWEYAL